MTTFSGRGREWLASRGCLAVQGCWCNPGSGDDADDDDGRGGGGGGYLDDRTYMLAPNHHMQIHTHLHKLSRPSFPLFLARIIITIIIIITLHTKNSILPIGSTQPLLPITYSSKHS